MANKKDLKKDVTSLTLNVLSDCILYMELYPESETEKVNDIMNGVVDLETEVRKMINNPEGDKKKHYASLKDSFFGGVTEYFGKVDELFAAKEK
ncbi:MAG: hypothetical protein U9R32_06545 [Bacteroidota bacterium]|nr:hypothetical protein [Bacteroidota bacterium]